MDVRRGEAFGIGRSGGVTLTAHRVVCSPTRSGITDPRRLRCGGELARGGRRVVDLKFACSAVLCGRASGGISRRWKAVKETIFLSSLSWNEISFTTLLSSFYRLPSGLDGETLFIFSSE